MIAHLRDEILAVGKEQLLSGGEITIRTVAAACGIASGTVYNYFSSKEELIAYILLEDWRTVLAGVRKESAHVPDCLSLLRLLYDGISSFHRRYEKVFSSSTARVSPVYHRQLITSLTEVIRPALSLPENLSEEDPSVFLAEAVLHAATGNLYSFEQLAPFLAKIIRMD